MTQPLPRPLPLTTVQDDALFALMATGDLAPLGELFDRYHAPVRHFLTRLALDQGEVDDLVQETFLTASRAASSFRSGASARPFLFGIAVQLVRRRRRGFARLRRMLERFAHVQPDGPHSALDRLAAQDRDDAVQRALAKLGDKHREVLVLVELGELSGVEAAEVLGVPPGTVWRRLSEARTELARKLKGMER